jgi:hypothetical protein
MPLAILAAFPMAGRFFGNPAADASEIIGGAFAAMASLAALSFSLVRSLTEPHDRQARSEVLRAGIRLACAAILMIGVAVFHFGSRMIQAEVGKGLRMGHGRMGWLFLGFESLSALAFGFAIADTSRGVILFSRTLWYLRERQEPRLPYRPDDDEGKPGS